MPFYRHRQRLGFYCTAIVITAAGAGALLYYTSAGVGAAALGGCNTAAFLLFGYDKGAARAGTLRVPESLILFLALLGGTPALLLGMLMFRHKTRDRTFLPVLAAIVLFQALLASLLWRA